MCRRIDDTGAGRHTTLVDRMNADREYFSEPYPARSTVLAPLSNPDLRVAIEAVAHIPR